MMAMSSRTGGGNKQWLFDPQDAMRHPQLAAKLTYEEDFDREVPARDNALTYIVEHLMDALPDKEREAVEALFITGSTQRAAGRDLGVDHHTVVRRAKKGLDRIRDIVKGSPWILDILSGKVLPEDIPMTRLEVEAKFMELVRGS